MEPPRDFVVGTDARLLGLTWSETDMRKHADDAPALLRAVGYQPTPVGTAATEAGAERTVRAGVRSIEHGTHLDDEVLELMLDHGTVLARTELAASGVLDVVAGGAELPEAPVRETEEMVPIRPDEIRWALDADARIAVGTDSAPRSATTCARWRCE